MPVKKENALRDRQLLTLGKMLAGYSHELKNHLAIINESAGLMDDLLDMGNFNNERTIHRFKKIISVIGERINKANSMAKYLSSFAHQMDVPISSFDINELLNEELTFLDRFFWIKSISVEKKLQQELPSVNNNPSLLLYVLFTHILQIIEKMDSGGKVVLSSQVKGQNIMITIDAASLSAPAPDQESDSPDEASVTYALEKMGIAIEEDTVDSQHRTTLIIPSE